MRLVVVRWSADALLFFIKERKIMIHSDEFWVGFTSGLIIILFAFLLHTVCNDEGSNKQLKQLHNISCEQLMKG